jgi:HPt (histidine-containing phosphotransfer) domain-containing protein
VPRLTESQRAQLESLRRSYGSELPAKLRHIAGAVDVLQADGWEAGNLQSLYDLIHRLAGSAAVYGFHGISRAAADLETWALDALASGISPCQRLELLALARALSDASAASGTGTVEGRRNSLPARASRGARPSAR